jgi:acyl carrier protein
MDRNDILQKVSAILRDIFDDDSLTISEDTTAADVEGWDSLNQINILLACEQEFNVKFVIDEVTGLSTVGDLVTLINSKV